MDLRKICGEAVEIVKHIGDFIATERTKFSMDKVEDSKSQDRKDTLFIQPDGGRYGKVKQQ